MAKKNTKKPRRNNGAAKTKTKAQKRTAGGKVPKGRTLSTHDNYLSGGKKTGSKKERPVVVIETNNNNDLAVVPMSSRKGNGRTRLKNYQQGQSYYKHYVEVVDDKGAPIRVNHKFKENHPNMDVSVQDVKKITNKVLNHSRPAPENRKKMKDFRERK